MPAADHLTATLPSASRLALAYAPASARPQTLALLALDARLAGLLRHSREPMLAQLRLSWWRESLGQDAHAWPEGEPLLALLRSWNGAHKALIALVDGWEALTGPAPLATDAIAAMADGRARSFEALATALQCTAHGKTAFALGREWGLADLAMRLGNAAERDAARSLASGAAVKVPRVPRPLRPLLVLRALAVRRMRRQDERAATSPAALLQAMRLGLIGR